MYHVGARRLPLSPRPLLARPVLTSVLTMYQSTSPPLPTSGQTTRLRSLQATHFYLRSTYTWAYLTDRVLLKKKAFFESPRMNESNCSAEIQERLDMLNCSCMVPLEQQPTISSPHCSGMAATPTRPPSIPPLGGAWPPKQQAASSGGNNNWKREW